MKKVLLTLLAVVVVLGLFAATGYAGYRIGYAQGAQGTGNAQAPELRRFDGMGPNRMLMPGFGDRSERDFERGFGSPGFPGRGFGVFPLMFLGRIAILALIVWFVYWLFTRSGWQLTRTRTAQPVETQANPTATKANEDDSRS